jgi:hypothetical protein
MIESLPRRKRLRPNYLSDYCIELNAEQSVMPKMGNKRPTNESRNKPKNILEKTSGMKYNIIQNVIDLSLASQTIEEINKIEQEWEKIDYKSKLIARKNYPIIQN